MARTYTDVVVLRRFAITVSGGRSDKQINIEICSRPHKQGLFCTTRTYTTQETSCISENGGGSPHLPLPTSIEAVLDSCAVLYCTLRDSPRHTRREALDSCAMITHAGDSTGELTVAHLPIAMRAMT